MEFWTTLIRVRGIVSRQAHSALEANCTHVAGAYWIMEGEVEYLRQQGVRFVEVAEGAVPSLGDLSEQELRQVCLESFGVRIP